MNLSAGMVAAMIPTPKGQAGTFLMVDSEVDLTYFKKMLDDLKNRLDDVGFIEKRASMASNDTSLEGKLNISPTIPRIITLKFYYLESRYIFDLILTY